MDKIMDMYITKSTLERASEAHANLSLPAAPFEFFDALDQARVQEDDELYFKVSEYHAFEAIEPFISDADNLLEVNTLCQELSELDERQSTAFEGLLKMEIAKKDGPISVGKLIDLAYSADCCHVVDEALNDAQLGRFYAENDFVPQTDGLSDELFELLNFEKIGREYRIGEGGVFTAGGYVMQDTELVEAYKDMTFTMRTPAYQIQLELHDGTRLDLPCDEIPESSSHRCLDCRIPQLMAAIEITDIQSVNDFAEMLQSMGDKPLRKYKAMLFAMGCDSLEEAIEIAGHMDDYLFEESVSSPQELARDELNFMIDSKEVGLLAQFTNLHSYGQAIMKRDNCVITAYGLLEREDHQPIQVPTERQTQSGMEMI